MKLVYALLFGLFVVSCSTTRRFNTSIVDTKQYAYRYEEPPSGGAVVKESKIVVYETPAKVEVDRITIDSDHTFKVRPRDKKSISKVTSNNKTASRPPTKAKGYKGYFYPVAENSISIGDLMAPKDSVYLDTATYNFGRPYIWRETEPVFKAISIPFKYRFASDSVSYEISTGANVGISFGKKWVKYTYRPIISSGDRKLVNHDLKASSWSTAGFLGLTTVDLKNSNTENLDNERKVLGLTFGGTIVKTYNKLSLGVAAGADVGFGADAKNWRHQWIPWIGIVVGIDFF